MSLRSERCLAALECRRPGLNRIIIEPSGLVILPDFVPYLRRLCEAFALELRPVIALLNPKRTKATHYESLPFFGGLVDHADILVANRTDQCSAAQLEHFREWTARLVPVKLRVLETRFGVLPPEIFDLRTEAGERPERFYAPHGHAESSGGFSGEVPVISENAFVDRLRKWIDAGRRRRAYTPFREGSGSCCAYLAILMVSESILRFRQGVACACVGVP